MLQAGYDSAKKRDEERETRIRLLKSIKSELDMNLVMLKEMDKKELYAYSVTFFLIDSYQSSVYGGDFSLLSPNMQNTLTFTYLQFKQLDILSDRLTSALTIPAGQDFTPKLAAVIVKAATDQAKATIPIVEGVLKKIDAELEQPSTAAPASGIPVSDTDVLRMIEIVDNQVAHPAKSTWFMIFLGKRLLGFVGLAILALAIYLINLFNINASGIPLDTYIAGVTLAIVTAAFAVTLMFPPNEPERNRIIETRGHLGELKKKAEQENQLVLGALVRMRVSLPPNATLQGAYSLDKSRFKIEEIVRRAVEP